MGQNESARRERWTDFVTGRVRKVTSSAGPGGACSRRGCEGPFPNGPAHSPPSFMSQVELQIAKHAKSRRRGGPWDENALRSLLFSCWAQSAAVATGKTRVILTAGQAFTCCRTRRALGPSLHDRHEPVRADTLGAHRVKLQNKRKRSHQRLQKGSDVCRSGIRPSGTSSRRRRAAAWHVKSDADGGALSGARRGPGRHITRPEELRGSPSNSDQLCFLL